jgi:hypothetical protein
MKLMSDADRKRPFQTVFNSEHTKPLAHAIGYFFVNFGVLETLADGWIFCALTDPLAAKEIAEQALNRKLHLIRTLLAAGRIPETFVDEAKQYWKRVEELSQLRNQLAHNPLFFGWKKGHPEVGAPAFYGYPGSPKERKDRLRRAPHSSTGDLGGRE